MSNKQYISPKLVINQMLTNGVMAPSSVPPAPYPIPIQQRKGLKYL